MKRLNKILPFENLFTVEGGHMVPVEYKVSRSYQRDHTE